MTQRMRLVPEVATQAMADALVDEVVPISEWSFQADYERMIAASPNGGAVTDADLERAAEAAWAHTRGFVPGRKPWSKQPKHVRAKVMTTQRAALAAIGLPLASEPPPAATEEGR